MSEAQVIFRAEVRADGQTTVELPQQTQLAVNAYAAIGDIVRNHLREKDADAPPPLGKFLRDLADVVESVGFGEDTTPLEPIEKESLQ